MSAPVLPQGSHRDKQQVPLLSEVPTLTQGQPLAHGWLWQQSRAVGCPRCCCPVLIPDHAALGRGKGGRLIHRFKWLADVGIPCYTGCRMHRQTTSTAADQNTHLGNSSLPVNREQHPIFLEDVSRCFPILSPGCQPCLKGAK